MKHLFIVHSHITFLVSLRVIERLGIAPGNVIFGTHRHYTVNDPKFKHVFSLPPNFQVTRNFLKNRRNINKWYKGFNSHVRSEYVAYVPHTFNLGLALVVSQSKCKSFNYIEEGMASYNLRNFIHIDIPWYRLWIYRGIYTSRGVVRFLFERRFFDLTATKLDKCYAVSESSFREARRRTIFDLLPKNLKKKSLYDCVVVFDALAVFKLIESAVFWELLEDVIIPHIKKNDFKKIAYKLHPEHYVGDKGKIEGEQIRNMMSRHFVNAVELDSSFILEIYFSQYQTTVYSYISSLGYYATLLGCTNYRLARRLAQINPKIYILDTIEDQMQQL